MKIGIDARLAFQTGVGRYIRNLLRALDETENELEDEYIVFLRGEDLEKIQFQNTNFKKIVSNVSWHSFEEQSVFLNQINKQNLDLMHFTYYAHPAFYNKPFVTTIHDLIIYHNETGKASTRNPLVYRLKRKAYEFVLKKSIKNSKSIIVPTYAVKEDITNTFAANADKINVIYEGVDKNMGSSSKKKGNRKNYFLYVGNAYPHKNLEFLLETFGEFTKTNSKAELILVGPNDYFYNNLKQKYKKNITFLHNISDTKLSKLYTEARALIHPSRAEGFGLTTLEAMANNCPVIASSIPVLKEVCQDHAFYFDPTDKNTLLKQIESIWKMDNKKLNTKTTDARKHAAKFAWHDAAEKTRDVYHKAR